MARKTTAYGTSAIEENRRRLQEEAERRAREAAERRAADEAKKSAENAEKAAQQTQAAAEQTKPAAQPEAPKQIDTSNVNVPDPAHTGVRSRGLPKVTQEIIDRTKAVGDIRTSVLDTQFGVVGDNYVAEKYKPHMDKNAQIELYAGQMASHAIGLGGEGERGPGNTIKVNRESFENAKQAVLFSTTMNDEANQKKLLEDYAEDIGVDADLFIAEAEKWMQTTYNRDLFKVPQTDGGKIRAANKVLGSIGLTDISGNVLDIANTTPQLVIQALRMNPDPGVHDEAYKAIQILQKTQGSQWYGMDLKKADFEFLDSADLTKSDYDAYAKELASKFVFAEGENESNANEYELEFRAINTQYADNPRMRKVMLDLLNKTFEQRNVGMSAPDAETFSAYLSEKDKATDAADDQTEPEKKSWWPWGKKKEKDDTLDRIIDQNAKNEQKAMDGMLSIDDEGNATYRGIGGDVALGNVYAEPADAEAPEVQGPQAPNGPTASGSNNLASATNAGDIGGLRLPEGAVMYADGQTSSGVNFVPGANNLSAVGQMIAADQPSVLKDEEASLPYDPGMSDAAALAAYYNGKNLDAKNYEQIKGIVGNAQRKGVIDSCAYGYAVSDKYGGDVSNFNTGVVANRDIYGVEISKAMQTLQSGALDDEMWGQSALILENVKGWIDNYIETPMNGFMPRYPGQNQYDAVIEQFPWLQDQISQVKNLLGDQLSAERDAKEETLKENDRIAEEYHDQIRKGRGTKEMYAWLAVHEQEKATTEIYTAAQEDDEYLSRFSSFNKNGDFWDDEEFWNGNSALAAEMKHLTASDKKTAKAFKGIIGEAVQDMLLDMSIDAQQSGMDLKTYLDKAGLADNRELAELALVKVIAAGEYVKRNPELQKSVESIAIGWMNAAQVGWNIGTVGLDARINETAQYVVYSTVEAGMVFDIRSSFEEKYGAEYAPYKAREAAFEWANSGALSEESKGEFLADLERSRSIYGVLAKYSEHDGLLGWLDKATNEAQKEVETLTVLRDFMPESEKRIVDVISAISGSAGTMALGTIVGTVSAPFAGADAAAKLSALAMSVPSYADDVEHFKTEKGAPDRLANAFALLTLTGNAAINYKGAEGLIGTVFDSDGALANMGRGFVKNPATFAKNAKTMLKYSAANIGMGGLEEGIEGGAEVLLSGAVDLFYDINKAEREARLRGEGFSPFRPLAVIAEQIESADPAEVGTELLKSIGSEGLMGMFFRFVPTVTKAVPALIDGSKARKFSSLSISAKMVDGDIPMDEENIGKFFLAYKRDMEDPAFSKYLNGASQAAYEDKMVGVALTSDFIGPVRKEAVALAEQTKEYQDKVAADEIAVSEAEAAYDDLCEQVADGNTDLVSDMNVAGDKLAKAKQTLDEHVLAYEKSGRMAANKVSEMLDMARVEARKMMAEDIGRNLALLEENRLALAQEIVRQAETEMEADAETEAAIEAESEVVDVMTDEELDADIVQMLESENAVANAEAEADEMGYDEETLNALSEQAEADKQKNAAHKEAIIRNQRNSYESLTARMQQAQELEDTDAYNALGEQRGAVQARLEALGVTMDQETNAPEPTTDTAPARPNAKASVAPKATTESVSPEPSTTTPAAKPASDPAATKAARYESAKDLVTGTTKEQRDAAAAEAMVNANVNAMDAETFIEQNYKDSPEDQKNAIREIWNRIVDKTPMKITGDIVQFASRVEKKFGVKIDFVDSLDGIRRGEITGNRIKVARDATTGDVVRSVILHELTHKAEGGGKLYDRLSKMILDMKYGGDQTAMDADIDQKVADYTAYYKAQNRTDTFGKTEARQEIVADYLGEIVNGNEAMIDRLVRDDKTLAQKIRNIIHDVIDKFTRVKDPQIDQMKKAVRMLDKAIRTADKVQGGTKYMITQDESNWPIVKADRDFVLSDNSKEWGKQIHDYIRDVIRRKSQFKIKTLDGEEIILDAKSQKKSKDWMSTGTTEDNKVRKNASAHLDEVVEVSEDVAPGEPNARDDKSIHDWSKDGWRYREAIFEDYGGKRYLLTLSVGVEGDNKTVYNIGRVEAIKKRTPTSVSGQLGRVPSGRAGTDESSALPRVSSSDTIISENAADINRNIEKPEAKYSLPSQNALEAQILAWQKAHQAEIDAAAENDGVSQQPDRINSNSYIPEPVKQVIDGNPIFRSYKTDSNEAQFNRAMESVRRNGYQEEVERLLDADYLGTDDSVEAGALAIAALESGDGATALSLMARNELAVREAARTMQATQAFAKMSPTHVMAQIGGEMELKLTDMGKTYGPMADEVKRIARENDVKLKDLRGGDELARLNAQDSFTVPDNKWGVPINEKQQFLIDKYKLNNVARPGLNYNRANTKQRMLEAILATPDPDEDTGNGHTLTERLEWMKKGKPVATMADLRYIADRVAEYAKYSAVDRNSREARMALARALEAYGNITPLTNYQKLRTQRFVNMLLSVPSALRNVIGNSTMNAVNAATHDTLGILTDAVTGVFTGKRTQAMIDMKARADGWHAFVEETKNTFRDYFIDKVDTSAVDKGNDKFDQRTRGRAFEHSAPEFARNVEGFLMSVGDRNFWKRAYFNSLAEQQRVAQKNGVEMDWNTAVEQAKADADYATFNEDGFVRNLLAQARQHPALGFVMDMIMPFTGVPTNITKRMVEYSPVGLAWSFGKSLYQTKVMGKNFDQKSFVEGVSRGLSGSLLFAIGLGLKELGLIELGTGEEDDEKLYNLGAAQGKQYSPFIRIGDEYISLAAFAPSVSPIIMGAMAYESFQNDDDLLTALKNASVAAGNMIFDASYMSGLSDLFDQNGSFFENAANTLAKNAISQNMPYNALLNQIATGLDPYVRDTKDKNFIMQALKSGAITKIPIVREWALNPKYDITGSPVPSKEGVIRNLLDPLTTTKVNDDPALKELKRIQEATGSSSHIPTSPIKKSGKVQIFAAIADEWNVNMDRTKGEHNLVLNAEEINHYNQLCGDLAFNGTGDTVYRTVGKGVEGSFTGIRDYMNSTEYQYATDEERAEKISKIYKKAKLLTQSQIVIDKGYATYY